MAEHTSVADMAKVTGMSEDAIRRSICWRVKTGTMIPTEIRADGVSFIAEGWPGVVFDVTDEIDEVDGSLN